MMPDDLEKIKTLISNEFTVLSKAKLTRLFKIIDKTYEIGFDKGREAGKDVGFNQGYSLGSDTGNDF